jgi:tetratricopeptide (TPR) repeat protein
MIRSSGTQQLLDHALALENEGRRLEADATYRAALDADRKNSFALYRLGILADLRGEHDTALGLIELALKAHPKHARSTKDYAAILLAHGNFLMEFGRIKEAVASFARSCALNPNVASAQFHEALCRLMLGDFAQGWRKYEWRWQANNATPILTNAGRATWTGAEPLDGKTIFLAPEQGYGDALMFIRYAPLLARQGARVTVGVHPPLTALVAAMDGITVLTDGDNMQRADFQCSLLSLPGALKTDLSNIPADVPYLRTLAAYDDKWRGAVPRDKALRVGLVWAGGHQFDRDDKRSIRLADFAAFLGNPDITFVSLQRDVRDHDAATLAQYPELLHFGDRLADFSDTASVIAQLDLVISVDTSVAHLAGALGKPLWMLLPFVPDFRWMLGRDDSPWYPTARLFRQPSIGDWASVIARVRDELAVPFRP